MIRRLLLGLWGLLLSLQTYSQGYYTFIDDDATSIEAVSSICQVAEERGVKVCFGVIANSLLRKPELVDTLSAYQHRGHQVLNHSLTHDKATWMEGDISHEVEASALLLDSLGFTDTDYLVYPFGCFSQRQFDKILPIVSKRFQVAFNSRGRYNVPAQCNRFYLKRFALRKMNDLRMVSRVIQEAAEQNAWIVFLTHSGMERDYSSDYVAAVMDECIRCGMENCTVKEYVDRFGGSLKQSAAIPEFSLLDDVVDVMSLNRLRLYLLSGALLVIVVLIVVSLRVKKNG